MVSVFVLMISAKPDPDPEELDEPEPPRLPAVVPVPDDPFEEEDALEDDEELADPPPDTASPGVRLDSEAIVPLTAAKSLVLFSAVSALCTPAWAEYTAAWAEAMLPGDGVVLVDVVEVVLGVEPAPPNEEDVERVVGGTTTVTVTCGVVLVVVVEPGLDFVFEPVFEPLGDPPGFVPGWNAAYSTEPAGAE
jgi:hypothetical protein